MQEKLNLANKECDDLRGLKMNNNEKNMTGECRPIVTESWKNFGSGSPIKKDDSYQSSDSDRLYAETVRNSNFNSNLSLNSNSNKASNSVDSQDYFNYYQFSSGSLHQSHMDNENENENGGENVGGYENEDEEIFDDEYDYNEGEEEEKEGEEGGGGRGGENYNSNHNNQIVNDKEKQYHDNVRQQEQHQYHTNPQLKHIIQIPRTPTNNRQENKSIQPNHQGTDNPQNVHRNIPQINPKNIPQNVPRNELYASSQSGYKGRQWIVEDSGEINSHHHSQQHTQSQPQQNAQAHTQGQSQSQQHTQGQGQGQGDGRSRYTESVNSDRNNDVITSVTVTTPYTQPNTPATTQSQHPTNTIQDDKTTLTSIPTPLKRNESKNQIRKKIWTKYFDPITELDYYHNRSTKVTTWDPPSSQEMELFMP